MTIVSAYLGYGLLFSEAGLALWRRSSRVAGSRKMDGGSLRLLWIVNTAAIVAGVWLALRGFGPRLPAGLPWGWIGVTIFAVGTALRWWAVQYLGRFFTVDVSVAADHRIVDTGPYRLIRHPSYSGLMVQFTGLALSFGSVPGLVAVMVPPFLTLLYRIRIEEAALRNGLGEAYTNYMRRTRQLIPWIY